MECNKFSRSSFHVFTATAVIIVRLCLFLRWRVCYCVLLGGWIKLLWATGRPFSHPVASFGHQKSMRTNCNRISCRVLLVSQEFAYFVLTNPYDYWNWYQSRVIIPSCHITFHCLHQARGSRFGWIVCLLKGTKFIFRNTECSHFLGRASPSEILCAEAKASSLHRWHS